MADKLYEMFMKQITFQQKLHKKNFKVVGNVPFIRTMTLAAIDELMEALREVPWKPWKKKQEFNQELFKEELIDVWHFLINLSLSSGMTSSEVYVRFLEKNKENRKRQKEGY